MCWNESCDIVMLGSKIVQQTTEKIEMIQKKVKASQSRKKSYHDKKRKALAFQERDHVFLRVTLVTGVSRVSMSRKLMPRFIGPY